ncbi:ATP-binding protein [Streptomyces daliensis]
MAVLHGPAGVGAARRRMREELLASGAPDPVVEDAVLILSELLSNACRHARPLSEDQCIRAAWSRDTKGELTVSVTDGGGPTRPLPATPSVTARGGRGLAIITALARDWGVDEEVHELPDGMGDGDEAKGVTVWAVLASENGFGDGYDSGNGNGFADSLGFDLASIDELR